MIGCAVSGRDGEGERGGERGREGVCGECPADRADQFHTRDHRTIGLRAWLRGVVVPTGRHSPGPLLMGCPFTQSLYADRIFMSDCSAVISITAAAIEEAGWREGGREGGHVRLRAYLPFVHGSLLS